jgi:hypothetical protein
MRPKKMVRRSKRRGLAERDLWNIPALDAGRPDHLAPFLGFVSDELTEFGRRAYEHHCT